MPDDAKHKETRGAPKRVGAPSQNPTDGDLTCSESQLEAILSEGESSRPVSKSDKGLHTKRHPNS